MILVPVTCTMDSRVIFFTGASPSHKILERQPLKHIISLRLFKGKTLKDTF